MTFSQKAEELRRAKDVGSRYTPEQMRGEAAAVRANCWCEECTAESVCEACIDDCSHCARWAMLRQGADAIEREQAKDTEIARLTAENVKLAKFLDLHEKTGANALVIAKRDECLAALAAEQAKGQVLRRWIMQRERQWADKGEPKAAGWVTLGMLQLALDELGFAPMEPEQESD